MPKIRVDTENGRTRWQVDWLLRWYE